MGFAYSEVEISMWFGLVRSDSIAKVSKAWASTILRTRIPTICDRVTTVVTPGEDVDIVVTDYGIAINPRRQDLIEAYKDSDLPFKTIEELRGIAYDLLGTPEPIQFKDNVVALIEARDGTILDVVREVDEYRFKD